MKRKNRSTDKLFSEELRYKHRVLTAKNHFKFYSSWTFDIAGNGVK